MPKKPQKLRPDAAEIAYRTMLEVTGQAPQEARRRRTTPTRASLFFLHYNYCRPHQTLTKAAQGKTTPAMASGLTDHVWTVKDIVALMDPLTGDARGIIQQGPGELAPALLMCLPCPAVPAMPCHCGAELSGDGHKPHERRHRELECAIGEAVDLIGPD